MSPRSPSLRRAGARVAFAVVLVVILVAALGPASFPKGFSEADKLHHLVAFAVLIVTMRWAFPRARWAWLVAAALGLGAGIELVQRMLPDHVASVWDFAFDALGVAIGWWLLRLPVLRDWRELRGSGAERTG